MSVSEIQKSLKLQPEGRRGRQRERENGKENSTSVCHIVRVCVYACKGVRERDSS